MILASQNVQIAEEKDFVREKISGIFFVNTPQNKNAPDWVRFLFCMCYARNEAQRLRGGSNLKAKRKRSSIVFATLYAIKQGAPEASVSSDTARLCDW